MTFRDKLIATLRAIEPVLRQPGVLVVGSEIPNLLEDHAAATLVVSEDVDIGVPVSSHTAVKASLRHVTELVPSVSEPSVWVPRGSDLLEVNFVGMDYRVSELGESYVLEDPELPLMVFGPLSHLRPGVPISVDGLEVPVPQRAGLMLEKLASERSGDKGDRDILVVLGLLLTAKENDLDELVSSYRALSAELRFTIRSNLSILSLLPAQEGMPNASVHRDRIRLLLLRLEETETET